MLKPVGAHTRLISRDRFRLPHLIDRLGMLPMEPGSLLMERTLLRGMQQCAERLADRHRRAYRLPPQGYGAWCSTTGRVCAVMSSVDQCKAAVDRAASAVEIQAQVHDPVEAIERALREEVEGN